MTKHDLSVWFLTCWTWIKLCCRRWEDRVTHVAAPSLKRVAKVLAAMAAGAWVVSTEFISASHAARALVEPVLPITMHALHPPPT